MTSSPSWNRILWKNCNISTRWSSISSQAGIHVVELAFEHAENILNAKFNMIDSALWLSHLCDLANSGHFVFWGDLTKLAITIADIDRFYWNLVICMLFDVALLLRNFVEILHCLWKLWNCIQRFTFFVRTHIWYFQWSGHFLHSFVKCFFQDILLIFIEISLCMTDTEQKNKLARFLRHDVEQNK